MYCIYSLSVNFLNDLRRPPTVHLSQMINHSLHGTMVSKPFLCHGSPKLGPHIEADIGAKVRIYMTVHKHMAYCCLSIFISFKAHFEQVRRVTHEIKQKNPRSLEKSLDLAEFIAGSLSPAPGARKLNLISYAVLFMSVPTQTHDWHLLRC